MGDTEVEVMEGSKKVVVNDQNVEMAKEGKVTIITDKSKKIFYNPIQEVNRDISILGIESFIQRYTKEGQKVNILEAMAASGIRSIRYAKEIEGVSSILANDLSEQAVESLKDNCELNNVENIIPNCEDASLLMLSRKNMFTVVDLDPYGSPIPCLDSAIQCVKDGGMLLVTATDMAVLAGGNTPETCFSKYGSMSIKTKSCQEQALRIVIHAVQGFANRYGKYVEPILSLKIDFYVRIFFRVLHSPIKCKQTAIQTSMIYQCTGCYVHNFEPIAIRKGKEHFSCNKAKIGNRCELCGSSQHVGGPIWTGPLHDKEFVAIMKYNNNSDKFEYLGTRRRIEGLLQLVEEEVESPMVYNISQLTSVVKCATMKLRNFRSAFLYLGYEISPSHTDPGTFKTNAPNEVVWEIFRAWHRLGNGSQLKEGTPGYNLFKYLDSKETHPQINLTDIHPNAITNPRGPKVLRFQMNPTKHWGPASRDTFKVLDKAKTGDNGHEETKEMKSRKRKIEDNTPAEANI